MEMELKGKKALEDLKVLLIGNNPIELSKVFESIRDVPGRRILTEIAFDLATTIERLIKFNPNYILIDDNIGKVELKNAVKLLVQDKRTRNTPITILKNSNYEEVFSVGVMDYMLKQNITGESLYTSIANSLKLRRTQAYLYKALKKRKTQLKRLASRSF